MPKANLVFPKVVPLLGQSVLTEFSLFDLLTLSE